MIRRRVKETVRKTGEQEICQAVEHAQAKTLAGTACLTCQYDKGCTQGIRVDRVLPKTTFSQVRVLSQGEKGILRLQMLTPYHAKYFAYELTKRCSSDSMEKLAGAASTW